MDPVEVVIVVVVAVAVFVMGMVVSSVSITRDCERLGGFYVSDRLYKCEKIQ
jgi:hypothetical protein